MGLTSSAEKSYVGQDNRSESRFGYCLNVVSDGIELTTANISMRGAQLCCPLMRYKGFQSNCRADHVRLGLKVPQTNKPVMVVAAVRYANGCDDEMLIGVEFLEFEHKDRETWEQFIRSIGLERRQVN
ncbi:MAG: PilZ domain-containing protein [Pseudomonadota bacterium]